MGNPVPQDDYKKRLDIACSILALIRNKLLEKEKAGDETKVTSYGDKEAKNSQDIQEHLFQEFMQANAKNFDFEIEPDGTIVRNIEGKKVEITEEPKKAIDEKLQKEQSKQKSKRTAKVQDEESGR